MIPYKKDNKFPFVKWIRVTGDFVKLFQRIMSVLYNLGHFCLLKLHQEHSIKDSLVFPKRRGFIL